MTKILFLGSQIQSYRCFKYLIENFNNINVVGISLNNNTTSVREDQNITDLAKQYKIDIVENNEICNKKFDLGISLLYDKILDQKAISIPKKGFINFHMGPLPRLRGCNSILNAILLARKDNIWEFGVTLHYMEEKVDTGPIIDKLDMPVFEDDTAFTLHNRASDKMYELFVKNVGKIIESKNKVPAKKQRGKSYFFKKAEIDHHIDIEDIEIYDKVRALTFPGKPRPFILSGGKKVYLTLEKQ